MRLLTLLVLATLLAACNDSDDHDETPPPAGHHDTAAIIGDSIIYDATADLSLVFNFDGNRPFVITTQGYIGSGVYHAQYWTQRLQTMQSAMPLDAMVINLGHNDILRGEVNSPSQIQAILSAIDPAISVFWVKPHRGVCAKQPPADCEQFKAALAAEAASRSNLQLLDFDDYMDSRHLTDASMIKSDGIHLTQPGSTAYAQMIQLAVAASVP